jgi:hypothetical protein
MSCADEKAYRNRERMNKEQDFFITVLTDWI